MKTRQWGRAAWWRGGGCLIGLLSALTGCIPSSDAPAGPNRAADLANLELSEGALSPAFGPDELNYTASVGSNIDSITITPTVADARATVKVNNQPATSGQPFGPISLALGTNPPITILVDGPGVSKSYVIILTRAPNADLQALELSAGALAPAFSPNEIDYKVETGFATQSTTVTARVVDSTSTLAINGNAASSGQPFGPITLAVGASNIITVRVTAANGVTKDYQVTVVKTGTTNLATLNVSAGPIAPAFNPNTLAYTVSTGFTTDQTTINVIPADSTAAVTVNSQGPVPGGGIFGPFPLAVGSGNTFTIVVTSPTVASKTYTVTITRQPPSSNANLSNLTVSPPGGTVAGFSPGHPGPYTVTVGSGQTSVTVAGFLQDSTARLEVNNNPANSGQGVSVPLVSPAPSSTPINVTVISQSGAVQTYGLIINRAAPTSGNSNLGSLAVSPGTLQPGFNPNTNNYNVSVSNATTSVVVTATTQDANATMTINSQPVQSGHGFTVGNLQVGNNPITIRVTAPAGNAENYVVTVNRAAPPSGDATLSSIVVNPPGGTVPGFNPASSGPYTVNEPFGRSNVTVSVTRSNSNASVFIDGAQTTSLQISLAAGPSSRRVNILVIAQDTVTTKSYAVDINVAGPSGNAGLSSLTVSAGMLTPFFVAPGTPGMPGYTVSVPFTTTSITVTAVKADPSASLTISPSATVNNLPVGNTVFTIVVTAQAGNSLTYRVTVIRAAGSTNAGLLSLTVSTGTLTPVFVPPGTPGTPGYTLTSVLPNTTSSFTVTAAKADPNNATMTINGVVRSSLTVNPLPAGNTVFTIVVTAQSGNSLTYRVTATRAP